MKPRFSSMTSVFGLALLIAAFLGAGCSMRQVSQPLRDADLSYSGGELDPAVWEASDPERQDASIHEIKRTYWGLPSFSFKNWFQVGEDRQEARAARYSRFGLGVTYVDLPLEESYAEYYYERGSAEPVGSIHKRENPFWATAWTEGKTPDTMEASVSGIPLFYVSGHERADEWFLDDLTTTRVIHRDFRYWRTLWNLGPSSWRWNDTQELDAGLYESRTRYFFPLLLGRGPGVLIYSDYIEENSYPMVDYTVTGHGPLWGYPLYFRESYQQYDNRSKEGPALTDVKFKLLGGGILWYSRKVSEEGEPQEGATGPLWSLFGSGYNDGEPVTYIFRIPFRRGSEQETEETGAEANED